MNNKTIKNLIAAGTAVLLLVSFQTASAYVPGVWDPQPRPVNSNPTFSTPVSTAYTTPVQPTTTNSNTVTTTNNTQTVAPAQTQTPTKTVSTNRTTTTRTVARANTTNTNSTVNTSNNVPQNQVYGSLYPTNNRSELTALSVNGSGSFMPSSIWQWLLVILLILVIIIIARMLGRKPAHHVHTVASH